MTATVTVTKGGVGELLREWRSHRRMSQLDLATEAGVSARHLSFVENRIFFDHAGFERKLGISLQ